VTTTRVHLVVTPHKLRPDPTKPDWLWDVTAEESLSGKRHRLGRVACSTHAASPRAQDLAHRERPDFVVVAVVLEPTPTEGPTQ
jgi:hypothetical protein